MVLHYAGLFDFKIRYFQFLLRAKGIVIGFSVSQRKKLRKLSRLILQSLTTGIMVSLLVQLLKLTLFPARKTKH